MRIKPFTVVVVAAVFVGCALGLWLRRQTLSGRDDLHQPTDLLGQFEAYSSAGDWDRALPVVEALVTQAPHIATSWFNWGVCLEGLGRHSEAAPKFMKAYSLQPTDYRAQYRVFRSLCLAHDFASFLQFARQEAATMPEVLDLLSSDPAFSEFTQRVEFKTLLPPPTRQGPAH